MKTKVCKTCGQAKPLSAFATAPKDGKRYPVAHCRECDRARHRVPPERLKIKRPFLDPATGQTMKGCGGCGQTLPVAAFGRRSTTDDMPRTYCRACLAAEKRGRYAADPDHARALARADYWRHLEARKAKNRAWRERNRAHVVSYQRRYNEAHRAAKAAYQRRRRASWSPEERRERGRLWRQANREKCAARERRRRERIANAPVVEKIDRLRVIRRDGSRCYLCGRLLARHEITLDHVVPLERGGPHTEGNLRVACRSCNASKGTKLLHELSVS